jgi:hypothetical protein
MHAVLFPAAALIAAVLLERAAGAGLCFVKYTVTDNNLEASITQDLGEIIESPSVKEQTQTTWVYSDMVNGPQHDEGVGASTIELYNSDGDREDSDSLKFFGGRYITWDHGESKMVVTERLANEPNSDLAATCLAFLTVAFTDCVAKGSDQFFLAFSSHGGGYYGFGGDENIEDVAATSGLGRRRLMSANAAWAGAITDAMTAANVPGGKLDVLGFDACLMSSCARIT